MVLIMKKHSQCSNAPAATPPSNQTKSNSHNGRLLAFTLIALMACTTSLAAPLESGADSSGGSSDPSSFTPKRQYFIAPRIGRSANHGTSTIWSSLEEASVLAPGQIQPNRGFPGPLRSSILFLVGNARRIGPRSASGLLPQARIGRRAAPSGLLPQPRVGRRSNSQLFGLNFRPNDELEENDEDETNSQQEMALAAVNDSTMVNEALESLMSQ